MGLRRGLYLGGLGWPECVTIAFRDNAVRYASGTLLSAWVYILRVDYSFEVLKRVERGHPPPDQGVRRKTREQAGSTRYSFGSPETRLTTYLPSSLRFPVPRSNFQWASLSKTNDLPLP